MSFQSAPARWLLPARRILQASARLGHLTRSYLALCVHAPVCVDAPSPPTTALPRQFPT
ncbi:hypothetical protein NY08_4402 [Rhodococcus sp. B7740]|nr:hypothetical protein NY08_4402 [Rhodococcus sp. B7740]